MRALLPFHWTRLSPAAQSKFASARHQFFCVPLLKARVLPSIEPALPDYLLLTSQNALEAMRAQIWFDETWRQVPTYGVGQKTTAHARALGFNLIYAADPPAPNILPHLPMGQGLWLSGTDTAHDLTRHKGLRRLSVYEMEIDELAQHDLKTALAGGDIQTTLITSARFIKELSALWPAPDPHMHRADFVALSPRLAAQVHMHFPGQGVRIAEDLESAIGALQNILSEN